MRGEAPVFQPWMSPGPSRGGPAQPAGAVDVVDVALECSNWLEQNLGKDATATEKCASDKLLSYFELFSKKPRETFVELSNKYADQLNKYLDAHKLNAEGSARVVRDTLVIKLYSRVVERLMTVEEERQKKMPNNTYESTKISLSKMMTSDIFHKSIFALASETVLFSFKVLTTIEAPMSLEAFSLTAWDLYKVITYFLTYMPAGVPRALRRHLQGIEHRLISELMWRPAVTLKEGHVVKENLLLVLENPDMLTAFKKFLTSFAGTAEGGACDQDESIPKSANTNILKGFAQKLLHLGAVRIFELCHRLGTPNLTQPTYALFKYILDEKRELIQNRDIDVVIMCSLYFLGRVQNDSTVTFRRITDAYKLQPQYRPSRPQFRAICGPRIIDEPVDIIKFYNQVYVPLMKSYVAVHHAPAGSNSGSGEPAHGTTASGGDVIQQHAQPRMPVMFSPKRVAGTSNVFMSPIRTSTGPSAGSAATPGNAAKMTPRTRSLYAFGESPGRSDFARINTTINAEPRVNASKRQLVFNNEAEITQKSKRSKYLVRAFSNLSKRKDSAGSNGEGGSTDNGGDITPTSPQ